MSTKTASRLNAELDDVTSEVVRSAMRVCGSVVKATDALLNRDAGSLHAIAVVEDRDLACRAAEDRLCHVLLRDGAEPSDLRFLLGAVRLIDQLARSGEVVRDIARVSSGLAAQCGPARVDDTIAALGLRTRAMFVATVDAWLDRDPDAAAAIGAMDRQVDALGSALVRELASGATPASIAVPIGRVVGCYERLGDHAVTASELVWHAVSGCPWSGRHRALSAAAPPNAIPPS